MGKTLITIDNLDQFIHSNKLVMDSAKILTPGARDELCKRGVQISYDEAAAHHCGHGECAQHAHDGHDEHCDELLIGVAAIIKQHYGITDPDELRKVTLETVAVIGKSLHA
ncbi:MULTISPECIES: hypothetical protein [Desulfovibrio]|uniref:Uncharacterized protein n=1 Tax=uncultured Desulfovibrio sp. TaxID=167968 RepID=A0A212J1C3_9BACT|nr:MULTISPECIES: hypothetical protein [Desulfovibrio]MBT9749188.1 hypothetical protein [Desulfovibrio desulfuricans]MCB6540777.1 hypothetical protein [Desulfovibrio desulfuricans]MCB6551859.1 hypothetical protein [Desulfovibrio desulfuricans]MCB6563701.1 hypothetical protein [Desulfovibrio desulfuricans]MCB7344709.1 hypothetical protein [Desulfovibrio desulfuricans]